jgi:hypothetical protein
MVLVTHEAREGIVWCSREDIMRGIVFVPQGLRKAILVEGDVKGNKWSDRIKC